MSGQKPRLGWMRELHLLFYLAEVNNRGRVIYPENLAEALEDPITLEEAVQYLEWLKRIGHAVDALKDNRYGYLPRRIGALIHKHTE